MNAIRRSVVLLGCVTVLVLGGCVAPAGPASLPSSQVAEQIGVSDVQAGTVLDFDPSTACIFEPVILGNVYETLTFHNPPGSKEEIAPGLATSWQKSADSLTWTFKLQPGVKFHDGTDFNSAAVKFSIERGQPASCASYLLSAIKSVETPDDLTVVFRLANPSPLDLIFAQPYGVYMMSPTAVNGKGADWFNAGHDAGTGPYKLEQIVPNERVVLTRFDDYWRGWKPGQFSKVVIQFSEDGTALEQMLRANQIDITASGVLPAQTVLALDGVNHLDVVSGEAYTTLSIPLNHVQAPTDNKLVRQALSYSFPYDEVVAQMLGGKAKRATGMVPHNMWGYDARPTGYEFDLEKAAALLAEAGYPNGGFDLVITYPDSLDMPQIAELWGAELAKLGIHLDMRKMTIDARWEWAKSDPPHAQHAYLLDWPVDIVSPMSALTALYHSEEQPFFNTAYYKNPEYDALVEEANSLSGSDRDAAVAKYQAAQRMLIDDAAAIFVLDAPGFAVKKDDIRGYEYNPAYGQTIFWYDLSR